MMKRLTRLTSIINAHNLANVLSTMDIPKAIDTRIKFKVDREAPVSIRKHFLPVQIHPKYYQGLQSGTGPDVKVHKPAEEDPPAWDPLLQEDTGLITAVSPPVPKVNTAGLALAIAALLAGGLPYLQETQTAVPHMGSPDVDRGHKEKMIHKI
ncbi:hypothetical protein DUI87_12163 [Hirundo rustica rustica]|uniref:Uncharacterized protein n=1 Tax=Hirundo rustica rustica TaxID=333673 RepID=A0A3M0KCS3_HIRRU|nr:hypothetical protein DUI87_12163 [Hirundo rustica rustica]